MALRSVFTIIVLLAVVGCSSTHEPVVRNLPAPNFAGPSILAPAVAEPVVQVPKDAESAAQMAPAISRVSADPAWALNVTPRNWEWIVIHHSASSKGSAAQIDRVHREERGWDELGYHFVIGNGTGSGDGQIEVGPRWPKQKWGAHAKTPDNRFNDSGIGICLVGNFDITRPTQKQLASLARLVAYLQSTYHIPADHIVGHGSVHEMDSGGTVTDCPGRNLNVASIRSMAGQVLADAGEESPPEAPGLDDELLHASMIARLENRQ